MKHSTVFKRELNVDSSKIIVRVCVVMHALLAAAIISAAMHSFEKLVWISVLAIHGLYWLKHFHTAYPKKMRVTDQDWYVLEDNDWKLVEDTRLIFQSNFFCSLQFLYNGKRRIIPIFVDAMSAEDYHFMAYAIHQKKSVENK